jgi:hypothetical protein
MRYQNALEAAGATVHDFTEFGSYQGTWLARITYNGITGWIEGSYGSCSGCDAFQAEFGWNDLPDKVGEDMWVSGEGYRPATQEDIDRGKERLADFGRSYLEKIATGEELLAEYLCEEANGSLWSDDREILDYLKANIPTN